MKKIICLILTIVLLTQICAFAAPYRRRSSDVYVKSYTRSDGTPVRGHYRSAPNQTTADNYGAWDYEGGGGDDWGY